ncbi:cadherin-like domain-containing protein [Gammaproteobacteria bacterium]|nr:cadherin-like domain-containing protein [Gammaproteobacteria bacterium]
MRIIQVIIITVALVSCGGGGGGGGSSPSVPFLISLGLNSFSVDEDSSFSGSIAASANESVTFTYSINTEPTNGSLTLSSTSAQISYTPNTNYYGSDQFTYTVSASNNTTKSGTVNITVNSVNDPPSIILLETNDSYENIYSDETFTIKVQVDDVDNEISELVFSSSSVYGDLNTSYNSVDSIISIDTADYSFAGPLDIDLTVSDNIDSASTQVKFWNLKKISDDQSINSVYTFLGNHLNNDRRVNYVIFVDAFEDSALIGIRQGLREWIDFINDDGIEYFVNNFFNINIIELSSDETRLKIQTGRTIKEDNDFDSMTDDEIDEFYDGIFSENGCGLRDDNMYCFNSEFVTSAEDLIKSYGINDIDNISVLTSTEGRGTACGGCSTPINIQDVFIGTNASQDVYIRLVMATLKHEFGHSFNDMADEYRSDYWDPEENPDGSINCQSVEDYYDDLIEYDLDENGVIDDDENTEIERDGLIFDWGCGWVDASPNTTSEDQPEFFKWKHHFNNPNNIPGYHDENTTEGLGIFKGTYYGIEHTSRPSYENIMGSPNREDREQWWYFGNKTPAMSWDKVGVESFVIQALKYQGLHNLNHQFSNTGVAITLDFVIPDDIFEIRWFIDGIENDSYKNLTSLTISKKNSGWEKIAYRIFEKNNESNFISVEDPIESYADVYQGFFTSFNQLHYCDEPYSDVEGYDDSICHGTVTAYDIQEDGTNAYGAYEVKAFNDLMTLYCSDCNENSHWMEYFIEYSGLGGQMVINWSNF